MAAIAPAQTVAAAAITELSPESTSIMFIEPSWLTVWLKFSIRHSPPKMTSPGHVTASVREPRTSPKTGTTSAGLMAAPLIGVASWIFDGIFIGATLTREMRRAMTLSVAVYAVALAVLVPTLHNHGLWAALMVLNGVRGITMARAFPAAEAKAKAAG